MDFKDYYEALGVPKGASQADIKRAFRKLARKHHPDVNPGDHAAERRFKEANEANEVLGDPEKRRKYDELGANWRQYEQAGAGGGSPSGRGSPFGGTWSGGRPGGGTRTMTPEEAADIFGGGAPFSDFFNTFFTGGAGPGGPQRPAVRRGRDLEHPITLTLEEVADGAERRLSLEGADDASHVDVKIPAGVSDGARVRVAGRGEPGTGGGPAGDLFLKVRQSPHSTFTRRGADLHVDVSIGVTVAVLGGRASVPRLRGTPLGLKIPPGTQGGQVFRLKGHGLPTTGRSSRTGELYATVAVRVPGTLTAAQRDHYEALAAIEEEADTTAHD
jgi:curved DNA-binding protein